MLFFEPFSFSQYGSNPPDVRNAAIQFIHEVFEDDEEEIVQEVYDNNNIFHVPDRDRPDHGSGMGRGKHLVKPSWML